MVKSRFITARAAARQMVKQRSGVIVLVTGSPARAHSPGVTGIGAAFGAMETLTENLAFEVSPFRVRVACLRTLANCRNVRTCETSFLLSLKGRKDDPDAQIQAGCGPQAAGASTC